VLGTEQEVMGSNPGAAESDGSDAIICKLTFIMSLSYVNYCI